MMLSKFDYGNDCNNLSNVELLRDIEEISDALYVESKTQKNSVISSSNLRPNLGMKPQICDLKSRSKMGFNGEDELLREGNKHSSKWHWKPLKALSHIMHKKFACYFFCHVHCVENLPLNLDGNCVSVCLRRKDNVLTTRSLRISNGIVEFEETLMCKCTVYGAKNGHGNFMKYDPKHFLLCVSVLGVEVFDVGKHWVDLTRLLPLTLEELEKDKCSGKWSTSFKLEGKAKDATLQVSFGFLVTKDSLAELGSNIILPIVRNLEQNGFNRTSSVAECVSSKGNTSLRRVGSVPSSLTNSCSNSYDCLDVKYGWPKDVYDFTNSINMLYGKLEEEGINKPAKVDLVHERRESLEKAPNSLAEPKDDFGRSELDKGEFTVIEKGVESESTSEEMMMSYDSTFGDLDSSTVEVIDVADIFMVDGMSSDEDTKSGGKDVPCSIPSDLVEDKHSSLRIEELSELKGNCIDEKGLLDTQASLNFEPSDDFMSSEFEVKHKGNKLVKSLSLDDIAKAVAEDFCNMWQESTSTSPNSNANLESPRERLLRQFEEDMMTTSGSFFLGVDVLDEETEPDHVAPSISSTGYTFDSVDFSTVISKNMNQSVNHASRGKIQAKTLERLETQSLMQRWGLNEDAFLSSPHYSSGGFGSPIFVQSEEEEPIGLPPLGEDLEPLLQLKDGGLLRSMSPLLFKNAKNGGSLVMQASKPLVFAPELSSDIMDMLQGMVSIGSERLSKKLHSLLPLDELSGKIMQQLAWDASYDAVTNSRPCSAQNENDLKIDIETSSLLADCNSVSSNSTVNDMAQEYITNVDLSALALNSIEALIIEGLKIQSGMSNDDAPSSIRVKSVNKTDNCIDGLLDLSISLDEWLQLDSGMFSDENCVSDQTFKLLRAHHAKKLTDEEISQNKSGKNRLLGDKLTVGLLIQLRDPLRNYESVGTPMLGLIQMERVFEHMSVSSEFRLKEVHVAGLNTESDHTESWASKRQQQTGSRWLLASGLTQKPDSHFPKSRSLLRVSTQVLRKPWTRSFLWSISRPVQGPELDTKCSIWDFHTRNPDMIFPPA
ncbi:hypothetical protein RND81_08G191400 [Saponaria officinalis]